MTVLKPFSLNIKNSFHYVLNVLMYSFLSMTTIVILYYIGQVVDGSANIAPESQLSHKFLFLVIFLLYGCQIFTLKNALSKLAAIMAENFSVRFRYVTENLPFPKQYEQLFGVESQRVQQNFGNSLNALVLGIVGLAINVTAILITNPSFGLLVSLAFILIVAFFNLVLKERQVRIGGDISTRMSSIVTENNLVASHNKEVFSYGLGKFFSRRYSENVNEAFQAMSLSSLIASFPKVIIEFLLVIGVLALVLSTVFQEGGADSIQSQLGNILFLGVVCARLIPNLQGIYASTMYINSVRSSLDRLISIPTKRFEPPPKDVSLKGVNRINIDVIPDLPVYVRNLKNRKLTLNRGKVLAITGDSGCGKTTLVESILGLNSLKITESYDGNGKVIGSLSGLYLPQRSLFAAPEILPALIENLAHDKKIFSVFKTCIKDIYPDFIFDEATKDKLTSLSAGQIQRIALCYILALAEDLIVLDEPTGALDKDSEFRTLEMLASFAARHNKFIIIISHARIMPEVITEVNISK